MRRPFDRLRALEEPGYTYRGGVWSPLAAASAARLVPTAEADAMHGRVVRRAHALACCLEGSEEASEPKAIADVSKPNEAKRWPDGRSYTEKIRLRDFSNLEELSLGCFVSGISVFGLTAYRSSGKILPGSDTPAACALFGRVNVSSLPVLAIGERVGKAGTDLLRSPPFASHNAIDVGCGTAK